MSILVLFRTGRVSQCLLLAVLAGSTLLVEGAGVFYVRGQASRTVPSDLTPQPGQIAPLLLRSGRSPPSGDDSFPPRPAIFRPGAPAKVCLQSSRSGASLPRGGTARPELRHGLLGTRVSARAEHQCFHGRGFTPGSLPGHPKGIIPEVAGQRSGTRLHRSSIETIFQ